MGSADFNLLYFSPNFPEWLWRIAVASADKICLIELLAFKKQQCYAYKNQNLRLPWYVIQASYNQTEALLSSVLISHILRPSKGWSALRESHRCLKDVLDRNETWTVPLRDHADYLLRYFIDHLKACEVHLSTQCPQTTWESVHVENGRFPGCSAPGISVSKFLCIKEWEMWLSIKVYGTAALQHICLRWAAGTILPAK